MRLHGVVQAGRGPMQIEIPDITGRQPGMRQSVAHRNLRSNALRVRSADVIRVRAFTPARQPQLGRLARENEESRAFADVDSGSIAAERIADLARDGLQCRKPVDGQLAKGIRSTAQHDVAKARPDQPCARSDGFGPRRARG